MMNRKSEKDEQEESNLSEPRFLTALAIPN